MKSFLNQKNKYKNYSRQSSNNEQVINRDSQKNSEEKNYINSLRSTNYSFKNVRDFSTDWTELNREYFNINDETENINRQYINWTIEFEKFDIRLLPFIDINILHRSGDGNIVESDLYYVYNGWYFVIEDIEDEINLKRVTLKAYLYIRKASTSNDFKSVFQGKLITQFINPRTYS